jgi:hypothetical protein
MHSIHIAAGARDATGTRLNFSLPGWRNRFVVSRQRTKLIWNRGDDPFRQRLSDAGSRCAFPGIAGPEMTAQA